MKPYRMKLTWKELTAIVVLLGVLAVVFLPSLARSREAARRASCQNNLKQLGLVLKMFTNEHKGRYPTVSPIPDNWIFDMDAVYPDYLNDLNTLICPSSPFAELSPFVMHRGAKAGEMHPDCVSSLFYIYTGYAVVNDEQAYAVYRMRERNAGVVQAAKDFSVPIPQKRGVRSGYGSSSAIPIMWDRLFVDETAMAHREPLGANVLHLDGHVEFIRYSFYNNSNYFPVTRLSAETFGSGLPTLPAACYPY